MNIQDQTTEYLVNNMNESTSDFTVDQIKAELQARFIPHDWAEEQLRGGIRPTHQPLNP